MLDPEPDVVVEAVMLGEEQLFARITAAKSPLNDGIDAPPRVTTWPESARMAGGLKPVTLAAVHAEMMS